VLAVGRTTTHLQLRNSASRSPRPPQELATSLSPLLSVAEPNRVSWHGAPSVNGRSETPRRRPRDYRLSWDHNRVAEQGNGRTRTAICPTQQGFECRCDRMAVEQTSEGHGDRVVPVGSQPANCGRF
jgi:hypothetical protein